MQLSAPVLPFDFAAAPLSGVTPLAAPASGTPVAGSADFSAVLSATVDSGATPATPVPQAVVSTPAVAEFTIVLNRSLSQLTGEGRALTVEMPQSRLIAAYASPSGARTSGNTSAEPAETLSSGLAEENSGGSTDEAVEPDISDASSVMPQAIATDVAMPISHNIPVPAVEWTAPDVTASLPATEGKYFALASDISENSATATPTVVGAGPQREHARVSSPGSPSRSSATPSSTRMVHGKGGRTSDRPSLPLVAEVPPAAARTILMAPSPMSSENKMGAAPVVIAVRANPPTGVPAADDSASAALGRLAADMPSFPNRSAAQTVTPDPATRGPAPLTDGIVSFSQQRSALSTDSSDTRTPSASPGFSADASSAPALAEASSTPESLAQSGLVGAAAIPVPQPASALGERSVHVVTPQDAESEWNVTPRIEDAGQEAAAPRMENFAGPLQRFSDRTPLAAKAGIKKSLASDAASVTEPSAGLGINVAKPSVSMVAPANFPSPAPAHVEPQSFSAVPLTFDALAKDADTQPSELTHAARRAVDSALAVAEHFATGDKKSVNLQFTVSGVDLAVRVELRGQNVQTTFRTDSSELRSALAHEWQVVSSNNGGDRLQKLADPIFTSGGNGNTTANHGSSHQSRDPGARQNPPPSVPQPGLLNTRSSRSASSNAAAVAPAAATSATTSRRLNTFA